MAVDLFPAGPAMAAEPAEGMAAAVAVVAVAASRSAERLMVAVVETGGRLRGRIDA